MIAQWIRERLSTTSNPARWFVDWVRGQATASGVEVDEQKALTFSAVWAATCFLTGSIAGLPLILYRTLAEEDRARAADHPYYRLLHDQPNDEQDSFMFWEEMALYLINWGNAYAEKEYLTNGRIVGLWPIPAGRVRPYRDGAGGPVRYEVTAASGAKRYLDRRDLLHVTGRLSPDGITGMGVVRQARESIGAGIATERFGAAFFGNGAVPGGVLEHPGRYSQKAEENLRAGWEKMHRGSGNASRLAVLWEGMKYNAVGISNEDSQFLESRQFSVTEIARWYTMPPHLLGDLSRATFSNIEEQDLEVVKYCLRSWLVRIERALKAQLLGPDESDLYWEFLIDALLRGDLARRTAALTHQFLNGAITIDEWRRLENRNRVRGPGGDRHFVPLNLVPLETAVSPPPPEPSPEPAPQSPPESPPNPSVPPAAIAAVRGRMRGIQATAIRRAARHPERFLTLADDFLARHEKTFAAALAPVAAASGQPPEWPQALAAIECAELREQLLSAAECLPDDLAARVEALLLERTQP